MATKEPVNARDGHIVRWSDVWRDGSNVFELVEKGLGGALPRDVEMPTTLINRDRTTFFRLISVNDVGPPHLWCDLEEIDAETCRLTTNVGPNTVLRLVSELTAIARKAQYQEIAAEISISLDKAQQKLT